MALLAILVLWLGVRLVFLPLRLCWRLGRALADRLGPLAMILLLAWTVALEPGPFLYLWRWFLGFGQALLVEAPRQVASATGIVFSACGRTSLDTACVGQLGALAQQVWSTAIGRPVSAFEVPRDIEDAAFVFAIGAAVAAAAAQLPPAGEARGSQTRAVAALCVSFVLALYLAIIAIVAIPVFGQRVPDLAPLNASLDRQLREMMPPED